MVFITITYLSTISQGGSDVTDNLFVFDFQMIKKLVDCDIGGAGGEGGAG